MPCDVTASDGGYSAAMGCTFVNPAINEVRCIGGLNGTSAAYAGRGGTIINHVKGIASSGTGQWFE